VDANVPLVYITQLDRICEEVTEAVKADFQFIILSDRKAGKQRYTPNFCSFFLHILFAKNFCLSKGFR
jgi:hypothetical protein